MINVTDIAKEIEKILNGTSSNLTEAMSAKRPFDGLFVVKTEGYHLDGVYDPSTGKNFFPVFLGEITGEFNAIPKLNQVDYEVPVSIYFPVRFKDKMLEMQEYLASIFVGNALGMRVSDDGTGEWKQYAVCNMSVPDLGEITDLDLDQFGNSILKGLNQFIAEQYKMPVSSSEPWICLNFSLYLSTMDNALSALTETQGAMYGNAYNLVVKYDVHTETITTDALTVAYGATTESQQGFVLASGISERESTSLAVTSAVSFTFEAVVKRDQFWWAVMKSFMSGTLDPNNFTLKVSLDDKYKNTIGGIDYADYMTEERKMVLTNLSTTFGVNEPLTATFTFTPRAEVE